MVTPLKLRDFSAERLQIKPLSKEVKDKWSMRQVLKIATKSKLTIPNISPLMKSMTLKTSLLYNAYFTTWIDIS
jgi:hypothetical protein